jgi:pyridoxine 5-phosphate synthase
VVRLSVNVNKVATLRNSRGGSYPHVLDAVRVCLAAGAGGITVHPRADARHITAADVRQVAALLKRDAPPEVEYNIEGDPRPDWLALVHEVKPAQATLVPVQPGEVTSQAGWLRDGSSAALSPVIAELKAAGIRVSLFVDAEPEAVRWAAGLGADHVELYTGPFAAAFARSAEAGETVLVAHRQCAELASQLGIGVNAGHDLELNNLRLYATLPHLAEVSIGHHLMGRALFVGLEQVVREYLAVLSAATLA